MSTNSYEVMFILIPYPQEQINPIVAKIEGVITANKGNIEKVDHWQYKALAYSINGHIRGYYVLISFTGSSECVAELDRQLRLNEDCLRHMIIRKGE